MITVPILTTSPIHFSLEGWENVLFELGSESVNNYDTMCTLIGWITMLTYASLPGFFSPWIIL